MASTLQVSSNHLRIALLKSLSLVGLTLGICMSYLSHLRAQPKQATKPVQARQRIIDQSQTAACEELLNRSTRQSQTQQNDHGQPAQPSACLGLGQAKQKQPVTTKELNTMNTSDRSKQIKKDERPSSARGALNVLGLPLKLCCNDPLTGYERDGFCHTGAHDRGKHTVCAIMTEDFLNFTKSRGNDLSTPYPQYNFPGLKAGDRWCLCALRWAEAEKAGHAPLVDLEATHQKTLEYVPLKTLKSYSKN